MKAKALLVYASLILLSANAQARVYFEPYVGQRTGSLKGDITITSPVSMTTTVDTAISGLSYGGKLGLSYMIFAAGADYSTGSLTEKDNLDGAKSKSTYTDMGAFVHVKLPILFTVKGTYIFSAKTKDSDAESTGKGFKIGLSTSLFHLFSLNVDMINIRYNDLKQDGITVSNVGVDQKTYMISLGVPLDF